MVSGAEEQCLTPWKKREIAPLQQASLTSFRESVAAINEKNPGEGEKRKCEQKWRSEKEYADSNKGNE